MSIFNKPFSIKRYHSQFFFFFNSTKETENNLNKSSIWYIYVYTVYVYIYNTYITLLSCPQRHSLDIEILLLYNHFCK